MFNFRRYFNYLLTAPVTLSLIAFYWLSFIGLLLAFHLNNTQEYHQFIVQWGASLQALTFGNEPWRLGSATLINLNFVQLIVLTFCLALAGFIAEKRLGAWRMLVVFFVGAICGTLLATIYSTEIVNGAIGGIAAWLGFCTFHYRLRLPLANNKNPELEQMLQSHTSGYFIAVALLLILAIFASFDAKLFIGGLLSSMFLATIAAIALRLPDSNIANITNDAAAIMLCGILATIAVANYNTERNVSLRGNQLMQAISANQNLTPFAKAQQQCISQSNSNTADAIFVASVNCLLDNNSISNTKLSQTQLIDINKQQLNWLTCSYRANQLIKLSLDNTIKQLGTLANDYCTSMAYINSAYAPVQLSNTVKTPVTDQQLTNMRSFAKLLQQLNTSPDSSSVEQVQLLKQWQQPLTGNLAKSAQLDSGCLFFCSQHKKLMSYIHSAQ